MKGFALRIDRLLAIAVCILASFCGGSARAATIQVPQDYSTVAEALDAAQPGDAIELAPGRYVEFDLVMKPGIRLYGTGTGPGATILDAQGKGRIMSATYMERDSQVRNLTFANGWAKDPEGYGQYGGALYINWAKLWLQDCLFENNRADASGGAICSMKTTALLVSCQFEGNSAVKGGGAMDCSFEASPSLRHCVFKSNTASYGGALSCRTGSSPQLTNVIFDGNSTQGTYDIGGAVITFLDSSPVFESCTFSRNQAYAGGALFADQESPTTVNQSTIVANSAEAYGAGIYSNNAELTISNSIIAFQDGMGLESAGRATPVLECTNIFGNTGGDWVGTLASLDGTAGNLQADPLFCETELDDEYHFMLEDGSPCSADGGACGDMGAWPVGCDTPLAPEVPALQSFAATWDQGSPLLVWTVDLSQEADDFRLMRYVVGHPGLEEQIPVTVGTEGSLVAQDAELVYDATTRYGYRLYFLMPEGSEVLLGELELDAPPAARPLAQVEAWPNPFNPQTTIHFELGAPQEVAVEIFNIAGQRVRLLSREHFSTGPHSLIWNGQDDQGRVLASGSYVVIVAGEKGSQRVKVTLLK